MPIVHDVCRSCKIGHVCKIGAPIAKTKIDDYVHCENFRCGTGVAMAKRQYLRWKRGRISPINAMITDPTTGGEREARLLEVTTRTSRGGSIDKTGYVTVDGESVVKWGNKLVLTGQKLF